MKVKILRAFHIEEPTTTGGKANWTAFAVGQVIDRPTEEAEGWCGKGLAAPIDAGPAPSAAPAS